MESIHLTNPYINDYLIQESFKAIRSNIQFSGVDVKVIAVTSCMQNEGKTSSAFNLANALAESGKKVVLLDADLRKSVFIGQYQVQGKVKGLSYFLSGQIKLEEIIYKTNYPNLYVTVAGSSPPNPAELLGNNLLKSLLNVLRETFDYVIVDTPPVGSVIDGAVVAESCDGIAFVIEANTVSYKLAQTVIKQLKKTNCRILGAILNKVNMSQDYYGKYYGK